jgi:hypothetical protein
MHHHQTSRELLENESSLSRYLVLFLTFIQTMMIHQTNQISRFALLELSYALPIYCPNQTLVDNSKCIRLCCFLVSEKVKTIFFLKRESFLYSVIGFLIYLYLRRLNVSYGIHSSMSKDHSILWRASNA